MTKTEYKQALKELAKAIEKIQVDCGTLSGTEYGGDMDTALSDALTEIYSVMDTNKIK